MTATKRKFDAAEEMLTEGADFDKEDNGGDVVAEGVWLSKGQPVVSFKLVVDATQGQSVSLPWTSIHFGEVGAGGLNYHGQAIFLPDGDCYDKLVVHHKNANNLKTQILIRKTSCVWFDGAAKANC